jgi:hypothetical protein
MLPTLPNSSTTSRWLLHMLLLLLSPTGASPLPTAAPPTDAS